MRLFQHAVVFRPALVGLGLFAGVASQSSCLVANEDHCVYQGGDAWCRAAGHGNVCVVGVDLSLPDPGPTGCYDMLSSDLREHVHAKYGLPDSSTNADRRIADGRADFRTIEGTFHALVDDGLLDGQCSVDFATLADAASTAAELRAELEPKKTAVRKSTLELSASTQMRFSELNAAIDEAFGPCAIDGGTDTGGQTDTGDSSSSGGDSSRTTADESTTTGPMPCEGNDECTDAAAPFCDPAVGECVSCDQLMGGNGDGACADADPMAPLCVGAACVACTEDNTAVCDGQLLVCDDASNTCEACTEHEQCDSGACDIDNGTCFDPANVFDVGMGQTYGTIAAALGEVGTMALDNAVLRLHEGTDFNEVATIDAGAVAFIAADGQSPQWVYTAMPAAPTLTVGGKGTRVYLVNVRMSGNLNGIGLLVDGATVDVRRSRIVQNSGGGIVAQGGAELYVENSFVGGDVSDTDAVIINGSTVTVLYSTFGGGFGSATALSCEGGYTVAVRNSVLVARAGSPELDCSRATVDNTALELDLGGTNTSLGEMEVGWFGIDGGTFGAGDFHLSPTAPPALSTAASWQDGDPPTDIDGDARPAMDGAADYAGADIVP